jgi:enediyne biosynthesis protein E4
LITTNNGPARLLRNDGGNDNRLLRVVTIGGASNRNGIGAKVRLTLDNGKTLWSMVKTGSSYLSQSELPLTFGLGDSTTIKSIEVTWPNGRLEKLPGGAANRTITVQEGKGIVHTAPLGRAVR